MISGEGKPLWFQVGDNTTITQNACIEQIAKRIDPNGREARDRCCGGKEFSHLVFEHYQMSEVLPRELKMINTCKSVKIWTLRMAAILVLFSVCTMIGGGLGSSWQLVSTLGIQSVFYGPACILMIVAIVAAVKERNAKRKELKAEEVVTLEAKFKENVNAYVKKQPVKVTRGGGMFNLPPRSWRPHVESVCFFQKIFPNILEVVEIAGKKED